jgi:hypothetical protein
MEKYIILSEYKKKIINSEDYNDAKSQLDIILPLTDNKIEKALMISYLNIAHYTIKMNMQKFIIYLGAIDIIYYRENAQAILNDIEININDIAQLNTLKRIIKNKPFKQDNSAISENKSCPHCDKKTTMPHNNNYVICGYTQKGFDWKGCGKDWCFSCEKKLCKSWHGNVLYNKLNRYHNSKCCKSFASHSNDDYLTNYCMCTNENVNRAR